MDDDARDTARRRLEAEAERVTGLIGIVQADIGEGPARDVTAELSGYGQHPADTGTETFEREKDFSILARLEEELAEVEAALDRIEKGTYGIDERTGEPIAPERLEALPAARTNVGSPAAPAAPARPGADPVDTT